MQDNGTNVVGGVTPNKGGQEHLGKPVFNSVEEAIKEIAADTSVIFVPAKFTKSAIIEAAEAGINLIICITEGVPVLDMVDVINVLKSHPEVRLIGPNCPGTIFLERQNLGLCQLQFI